MKGWVVLAGEGHCGQHRRSCLLAIVLSEAKEKQLFLDHCCRSEGVGTPTLKVRWNVIY